MPDPSQGSPTHPRGEVVARWVEQDRPEARELGGDRESDGVLAILDHTPSYPRQRAVVSAEGTLRDAVELLRREFATDQVGG
jgi:gamma-glutamyl:cysteine ligase YbdK (ATP-grasp superfamily)